MVPAGSTITFSVVGTTAGLLPIDATDLRSRVVDRLGLFFTVLNCTIARGSTLGNIIDFQWLHWNYTATVTIKTRLAYGATDDVRSVIANAFYLAGGALPTVTTAGETAGQVETTTGPDAFGGLKDLITNTELLIVGGLVLIVGLVVFSPAGKTAAGALRVG